MVTILLVAAGLGQVAIAFCSLFIPRVLGWREETQRLGPLTRQVFWTYAAYIWSINVCMGLVSCLAPHWLLDDSGLGRALCGFITVYWATRCVIQFTIFKIETVTPTLAVKVGTWAMDGGFVGLTGVYALAFLGVR